MAAVGMIRREITAAVPVALALTALLAGDRRAHGVGFDLESFKPAATGTGYLCEESARTLPAGALEANLSFGYAHRPLVLRSQVNGGVAGDIVGRRSTGYVGATYGLVDRIDVGFRLPVVLAQFGDVAIDWTGTGAVPQRPPTRALGDLDVMARVRLAGRADRAGMRLTLSAPLGLPVGDTDALVGTGSVSFRPRLIAGWESPRLSVGVSAGYEFRRRTQVPGSTFVVGQAIGAGAGVAVLAFPRPIGFIDAMAVLAEVSASVGLEQPESGLPAFPGPGPGRGAGGVAAKVRRSGGCRHGSQSSGGLTPFSGSGDAGLDLGVAPPRGGLRRGRLNRPPRNRRPSPRRKSHSHRPRCRSRRRQSRSRPATATVPPPTAPAPRPPAPSPKKRNRPPR